MQSITPEFLLEVFLKHPYISTDSRKVMPGSIFFALKGDNFDGNRYAADAIEKGAAFAVIDDPRYCTSSKLLFTDDVLSALQKLASMYRDTLKIPVIGITGTNGKTTTKELIATALSQRFNTLATHGNLNNHIGVPLTLLSVKHDTEIAVVEMGANHPGEIAALAKIARPTHGIITNIGKAHLEGFGGFEGVIKTKRELYDHLIHFGGLLFVNSNNPLLMDLSRNANRITYGSGNHDTVSATAGTDNSGCLQIHLNHPVKAIIPTKLAGKYNLENVLAALCIANHFKVGIQDAIKAIAEYTPGMNRSQIQQTKHNTLILDAYNANPTSMKAAIENFMTMNAQNKVLILGDMFELGAEAPTEHDQIIKMCLDRNFSQILTAGPHFKDSSTRFHFTGAFESTEALLGYLQSNPLRNALVLIKGSRGMHLETIIPAL